MAVVVKLPFQEENPPPDTWTVHQFLMGLAGVVEAKVWVQNERLLSHVLVSDDIALTPADIQQACKKKLGIKRTPSLVLIERIQRPREFKVA